MENMGKHRKTQLDHSIRFYPLDFNPGGRCQLRCQEFREEMTVTWTTIRRLFVSAGDWSSSSEQDELVGFLVKLDGIYWKIPLISNYCGWMLNWVGFLAIPIGLYMFILENPTDMDDFGVPP